MPKQKPNHAETQREKFEEAAREAGTDDREEVFDAMVKRIAKAAPAKSDEKRRDK